MSLERKMSASVITEDGLLEAKTDNYGGVTVDMQAPLDPLDLLDPRDFATSLRASLAHWKQQGKRGIWVKLPLQLSSLVDVTIKEGFRYHHAEPDYVMLLKWLPDTPDSLPANASHTVGVGAFVLNDKNQVLVVQERCGAFKGTGVWKLVTGVVNQGENLCDGAIREVKEETGIDTEFVEVLSFHQSHKNSLGKSDLFFVCMLKPLSTDIKAQESEIENAQWMDIEEYIDQPYNKKYDSFRIVADICRAKANGKYSGISAFPITSSGQSTYLYFNGKDFS